MAVKLSEQVMAAMPLVALSTQKLAGWLLAAQEASAAFVAAPPRGRPLPHWRLHCLRQQ